MVRGEGGGEETGGTVSLRADVPESLLRAMRGFIECHPNWDQYRLFQAALAGFLVQNGVSNRGVTRCYLANLFPGQSRFQGPVVPSSSAIPPAGASHAPSPAGWPRRRSGRPSPTDPADRGHRAA